MWLTSEGALVHPDGAMNNRASLADAARIIKHAASHGFAVKTEVSEVGSYTMHSIPLPRNPYTDAFAHVIVVVTHPRRGHRSSVRVSTTKHGFGRSAASPDIEARGVWDAHYAIRETAKDLASWNKWQGILSGSLESSGL